MFGLDPSSLSLQYTSQIHTFSSWSGSQGHSSPLYFTPFASGGIIFLFTPSEYYCSLVYEKKNIIHLQIKSSHYSIRPQNISFDHDSLWPVSHFCSLSFYGFQDFLQRSWFWNVDLIIYFLSTRICCNNFHTTLWSYLGIQFTFRCNSLVSRGIWSSL